jgi:hypothetical protein
MNTLATPKIKAKNDIENQLEEKTEKKVGFKNLFLIVMNRITGSPEMTLADFERIERRRTPYTMWRESSFHEGNWR